MKEKKSKNIKTIIKNLVLIALGTFILAFGAEVFLAQTKLVTGGMSGIAIIIDELIPGDKTYFELIVTIETWAFFILGLFFLGKDFSIKTLFSAILYPIFIYLCSFLINKDLNLFNGFFIIEGANKDILSCVFGGTCTGIGCALTFMGGGSTGGTDIIPLIVCKYVRKLKSSVAVFFMDALVVFGAVFVIKDFSTTLLGIVAAFICAISIDKIFLGPSTAFTAQIITKEYEELTKRIITELERTTTILTAEGGYSHGVKKIVWVSFTMNQYNTLMNIIHDVDSHAFSLITKTHFIGGEGWTYNLETGGNKE